MQKLAIIITLLVSSLLSSQTAFEKGMQKAFKSWQEGNLNQAEQLFERIANAEPEQWLPSYYVAQINSLKSWNEKDIKVLTSQLEKAQTFIDKAKHISPNNAEVLVLQAHIHTNWVAYDGATYGMKYGAAITGIYDKAFKLSPENPRVIYSKAEWAMGSARFFGQDTKPFCKDIEKAIELFATFKPESAFHPNWGEERASQVLSSCKE